MADPKVINYAGEQKIYNKENVDALLDLKQDTLVPDVTVQNSVNVVTNTAVKAYVDAETQRAESAEGDLNDLNTTNKSNLVAAINEVKDSAYTVDEHVTAGSTNPVQNTGVKEYVDTRDEATLQYAKGYTDDKIGKLEPGDGSTVVELTGHLGNLKNAAESLVTAINNIDGRVEQNLLGIEALETGLTDETSRATAEEQKIRDEMKQTEIEELSNLHCLRFKNIPIATIQIDNNDKSVNIGDTIATVSARYLPKVPVDFVMSSEQIVVSANKTFLLMLRLDVTGNINIINMIELAEGSSATDTATVTYFTQE